MTGGIVGAVARGWWSTLLSACTSCPRPVCCQVGPGGGGGWVAVKTGALQSRGITPSSTCSIPTTCWTPFNTITLRHQGVLAMGQWARCALTGGVLGAAVATVWMRPAHHNQCQ